MDIGGWILAVCAAGLISNSGTLQANGGRLELTNDTVTNSNALKAINNSILELTNTAVANLRSEERRVGKERRALESGASSTESKLGNSGEDHAEGKTALFFL